MRNIFRGYYEPTPKEFEELWKNCIFVLDANVLLNLYRYTPDVKDDFIRVLTEISKLGNLWIPYQAALEYQENRIKTIADQKDAYDKIKKVLDDSNNRIENELNNFKNHPLINKELILNKILETFDEIKDQLDADSEDHPDLMDDDSIREEVTELLNGNVGEQWTKERLESIYKDGKIRYEKKIPPGFMDADKDKANEDGVRKFGDLVLWFQLIEKAKTSKKPIIFVTNDKKEDWWWIFRGKTIGPNVNLIQEFIYETGIPLFYMYSAENFLECSNHYLKLDVKQKTIEEVQNISKSNERAGIYYWQLQNLISPQTKTVIFEPQYHEPLTTLDSHTVHGYQGYSNALSTYAHSSPMYMESVHSHFLPETNSPHGFGMIYNKKLKKASSSWEITYDTIDLEEIIEERILSDIFEELDKNPSMSEAQASVLANAIANRWSKFNLNIRLRKPLY